MNTGPAPATSAATLACARCGANAGNLARFCAECGAPIGARALVERRHATAMFADLTGSTRLAEAVDAEVVQQLLERFVEVVRHAIHAHGGTVELVVGDLVIGMFGLRSTHEDDAERAVRAALAAVEGIGPLRATVRERYGPVIGLHCGVESGEVVADLTASWSSVAGDTLNVAARLEELAPDGEVWVGGTARGTTRHSIAYRSVGRHVLHGKAAPVPVWRALRPTRVAHRRAEASMVGREAELGATRQFLDDVRAGGPTRLLTVAGPAGIGKSRLATEVAMRAEIAGWRVLRGQCLPYGDGITWWPLADIVRDAARIRLSTSGARAWQLLRRSAPDEPVAHQLAAAMGIETGAPTRAATADLGAAFVAWSEAQARSGPVLMVLEDLHWAQDALLDVIEQVAAAPLSSPLALLALARSDLLERRPAWGNAVDHRVLPLGPLGAAESAQLAHALLGPSGLSDAMAALLVDHGAGNPLFVEESVRMLVERGDLLRDRASWRLRDGVDSLVVPRTIDALVRCRLEHLQPTVRAVLESAAVIGRLFDRDELDILHESPTGAGVAGAVDRELVAVAPDAGPGYYRFHHIAVRDAVYGATAKARRALLHRRYADLLATRGDAAADLLPFRAHHMERAVRLLIEIEGLAPPPLQQEAVSLLATCARRACDRGDLAAANALARSGLGLAAAGSEDALELGCLSLESRMYRDDWRRLLRETAPLLLHSEATQRRDLEARLLRVRGHGIINSRGLRGGDRSLLDIERAHQLMEGRGSDADQYRMTLDLGIWAVDRCRRHEARRWFTDARRRAEALGDAGRIAEVMSYEVGTCLIPWGHLEEAEALSRESIAYAEAGGHRSLVTESQVGLARAVAFSRSLDEALHLLQGAEDPRRFGFLYTSWYLHDTAGWLNLWGNDADAAVGAFVVAVEAAEAMRAINRQSMSRGGLAHAQLIRGEVDQAFITAQRARLTQNNWAGRMYADTAMAMVASARGEHGSAGESLDRALMTALAADSLPAEWHVRVCLVHSSAAAGEETNAASHRTRALEICASLGPHSPLRPLVPVPRDVRRSRPRRGSTG